MANNFLTNLRASRGNSQTNSSSNLPTRGDMQKQRQAESSVAPDSFIKFLRGALGIIEVPKGKEQQSIEDVPAHNVDKMSPEDEQRDIMIKNMNEYSANQGLMRVDNDLNKYNAAVNGTYYAHHGKSDFENAYGVLENYDALNKVLDEYDNINTWTGKQKFLIDAYKRFDDKRGDIAKWFNRLYGFTLEAKDFGEWNTKSVTDNMRELNKNIKDRLIRRS